jgi:urease accessory protein
VSGDAVQLEISVAAGATASLGTQAETKVYRSAGGRGASQALAAAVAPGGLLALLPDPVSPFAGARYEQLQRFHLAAGASLVVLDAVTAGRAARGERWAFARYASRNEVRIGGELVLADGVRLDADQGPPLPRRLAGVELLATIVILGPRVAATARDLLQAVGQLPADGAAPVLAAASPLADGAILRLASRSVEEGMEAVRSHLSFLAAPLDGDPLLRRP